MRFPLFVAAVSRRSGLPSDQAATVARAVLDTVVERMAGAATTADPTGYLPDELTGDLPTGSGPSRPVEFLRRVAHRAGVDGPTASAGTEAVFATLRETVTVDEFRHLVAQLRSARSGPGENLP
ncbi:DUF2267 domain-containing protein [Micromonospora craniellae]|uniref:DUF2267 domain-containing protein n=1 Tax=Micromonospora craniellae TaxID=2294034 RepID=A0A372G1L2_9ACTN|nr:DUF2267 domain-containing protein [Micromonospora craniellae]QOC91943.1 DUF2267 domain-containing protein [Micromonospora craniellae]RFS46774.1 DUF2267 domain-containing protein [Micromonospora craniellae]